MAVGRVGLAAIVALFLASFAYGYSLAGAEWLRLVAFAFVALAAALGVLQANNP